MCRSGQTNEVSVVTYLRSSVVWRVLSRLEARVVETLLGKPEVTQLQPGAIGLGAVQQVLRFQVPASRIWVAGLWIMSFIWPIAYVFWLMSDI